MDNTTVGRKRTTSTAATVVRHNTAGVGGSSSSVTNDHHFRDRPAAASAAVPLHDQAQKKEAPHKAPATQYCRPLPVSASSSQPKQALPPKPDFFDLHFSPIFRRVHPHPSQDSDDDNNDESSEDLPVRLIEKSPTMPSFPSSFPSLQSSSASSEDDLFSGSDDQDSGVHENDDNNTNNNSDEEPVQESRGLASLLDEQRQDVSCCPDSARHLYSAEVARLRSSNRELLEAAAKYTIQYNRKRSEEQAAAQSNAQFGETRTTISSSARHKVSLREKFRTLSRDERKSLLLEKGNSRRHGNNNNNSPSSSPARSPSKASLLAYSPSKSRSPARSPNKSKSSLQAAPPPPPPPPSSAAGSAATAPAATTTTTTPAAVDTTQLSSPQPLVSRTAAVVTPERQRLRKNERMMAIRDTYNKTPPGWADFDKHSSAYSDFPVSEGSLESEDLLEDPETTTSGETPTLPLKVPNNTIRLHVYDLISKDTLMMVPPFGCLLEIGQCFNGVNSALHELGTGAYHVGIEVNGVEFAYGATNCPNKSGIFTCYPMLSPGYQYRTTIDFGERPMVQRGVTPKRPNHQRSAVTTEQDEYVNGQEIVRSMARDYMGIDYDILRKNCCSFACDACLRLGIPASEIPRWFRNLAESGAMTQDAAFQAVEPITSALSICEQQASQVQLNWEKTRSTTPGPASDASTFARTFTWAH